MVELPKQDWQLYEEKCHAEHVAWMRSLSPSETLILYEDFYRLASRERKDASSGFNRLAQRHWEEKLAIRKRVNAALAELDRIRSERAPSQDAHGHS